jgi:hypothetical protein
MIIPFTYSNNTGSLTLDTTAEMLADLNVVYGIQLKTFFSGVAPRILDDLGPGVHEIAFAITYSRCEISIKFRKLN